MVLQFHMQHDQTARLQNNKIQPSQESKMAAETKYSETNEVIFFSRTTWYIWRNFYVEHYWDLVFRIIKTEKSVAKLSHSDLFSVYESSFAKMPISQETTAFNQIQSE